MGFKEENDKLLSSLLDRTFFKAWKEPDNPKLVNFRSLEFMINYRCNLTCRYCYVNRYGDELYPKELYSDEKRILQNLELVLDWMLENSYSPKIEIFGGEPLVQNIGFKCLDLILEKLSGKVETKIVIPTNFTFLLNEKLTERVEELLEKSKKVNLPIFLSASFDGKYCESNRPFRGRKECRDDEYYDKCFSFASKWKFGFHPMIYSRHIEKWKDNFLWFQKMMQKHDIPFHNIYLLEVRNQEWTLHQTKLFGDFVRFLIHWSYRKVGRANFLDFLFKKRGFNILTASLSTHGRGIGCSFQSALYLRLGDLAIVPCHRTCYKPFVIGRFKVDKGKIVGVEANNIELGVMKAAFHTNTFPYCETCLIKSLCSFGCLGAQLETTGDMFTPIPR